MDKGISSKARASSSRRSLGNCVAWVGLTLLCGATQATAQIDKTAGYQEMQGLAQQMQALKPELGSNPAALSAFQIAESRYTALSLTLGGDDPAHSNQGVDSSQSTVSSPGVFGGPPSGCSATATVATNVTPVNITTGTPAISTIVVAGVGDYLLDLDMTTQITHTFASDLDITLTSPAGTVVTITTDNGGGNDNVFDGTIWDDSANPAGQVPYTSNNGLVTDQTYVNNTTATPLVPEGAMGAFIGEDPNGTWTLTIVDDAGGDDGTLSTWSLDLETLPAAPNITAVPTVTGTPGTVITTATPAVATLVVAGAGTAIGDVDLTTFITHTFASDLDMTLQSPSGTVVTLSTDNGGGNDDIFDGTVWDDSAATPVTDFVHVNNVVSTPLQPEEAMGAFVGEDPNGTWTLTVVDDAGGDDGLINSWSLDIDTFECGSSADLSITKTDGLTTVPAGQPVTYTITASNAGPDDAPAALINDSFPAPLAACTWTCAGAGGGTCAAAGAGTIAESVNLPNGGSVTFTSTCSIPASTAGGTIISNSATVDPPVDVTDPTLANNSATDTTTTTVSADLAITKTDGVTTVIAGNPLTYTIVASNAGPSDAVGSTVTDTFPGSLTCTWTCTGSGGTCTAAGSGNINDTANLPSGTSVTYTASCSVVGGTPDGAIISNTATVAVAAGATDPNGGNNSATDTTSVIAGSGVSGTKTVSGTTAPGGSITYSVVLNNAGPGNQADNPGDEFVDVLPSQVSLVAASASSGTATMAGNTVSWNGAIAAASSVTITIDAIVSPNAFGLINNQGTINFDSNGDGTNDASALTDNPAAPGPADPTGFAIGRELPTLGPIGMLLLTGGLIAIWYRRQRIIKT